MGATAISLFKAMDCIMFIDLLRGSAFVSVVAVVLSGLSTQV